MLLKPRTVLALVIASSGCGGDGGNDNAALDLAAWESTFTGELTTTFAVTEGASIVPSVSTEAVTGRLVPGPSFDDPSDIRLELGVAGDLEYRKLDVGPTSDSGGRVRGGLFGSYLHPSDATVTGVTIYVTNGDALLDRQGNLSFSFSGDFSAQQGLSVARGSVTVTFP